MNNYSARKLWSMGQMLKKHEGTEVEFEDGTKINFNSWFELTADDLWIDWVDRKKITKDQLAIIKQGYANRPLQNPELKEDSIIFPFSPAYKGKPIEQVPIEYIDWCRKQDWIEKWPTLNEWLKRNKEKIDARLKETEDGMEELKQLRQQLQ